MPILPTIPTLEGLSYPVKKLLGFAAKNSMQAQGKSEKEILRDLVTGNNPSFYSWQTRDGGNEIDTYLYGIPYNTENTSNIGPSYENYLSKNFPLRKSNVKTYDTHFGDTLYIDQKYKDQVLDELEQGKTVGASMGRYAHAPSYIVNTKDDERRPYDAGGHLMQFQYDKDRNVVANMSDIYDFLPKDFEDKYGAVKEYGPLKTAAMYAMHYAGTPFIVRQNNIPVRFKEITPEYKTEWQQRLGDFLSQWGNKYDLTLPLKLTDEEIFQIFADKEYEDEILNFMFQEGYLQSKQFKKGGRIHIKKKNRGSFTRWCKGKVTEECIRRGKNSSNPAIRKKATFAANARRWKHENGGILKAQEGTGNLYAPHPLSPVGIALNQARAMSKGKKDQQHLPPGVKEVVGPDGKKVAIRTEQPLQPMGQEVAAWLPGVGDAVEVGQIVNDVKNGNLGTAALAAGLMVLPGNARKILDKFGVDLGDISTFRKLSDQEWDDMYFQAIDSGDMDLVQTIRDAHFKVKAPNTKVVDTNGNPVRTWHGTDETFTEFNPDYTRRTFPGYPRGTSEIYFTPQRELAERYAGDSGKTLGNYLNIEHLDVPSHTRYEDWKVNDGYVFKQSYSPSVQDASEIIVHNPKNIKSSNSITLDDNRNIIPISKRDNFDSVDFRYGFAPIVLGLGAAKAVSNNNTKEQQ